MSSTKKQIYSVLRSPLITEKAANAGSSTNTAVFEVHPEATKNEIRQAVEKIFKVKVEGVRTVNCLGKLKRVSGRLGKQPDWKKAYVRLAEGSSIDVVEGL
jgi:large subunit ribosomal protein L23